MPSSSILVHREIPLLRTRTSSSSHPELVRMGEGRRREIVVASLQGSLSIHATSMTTLLPSISIYLSACTLEEEPRVMRIPTRGKKMER
jgi:hypothetical protein